MTDRQIDLKPGTISADGAELITTVREKLTEMDLMNVITNTDTQISSFKQQIIQMQNQIKELEKQKNTYNTILEKLRAATSSAAEGVVTE